MLADGDLSVATRTRLVRLGRHVRRWPLVVGSGLRTAAAPLARLRQTPVVGPWPSAVKATLLRRVPQRFHAITDEVAKFGTIGLINLVVNFAVFNLLSLTLLRSGEVKAKAVATIVATTCAYFLNRYWTYRNRPKSTLRREYTLFFLFNVVGLFIEVTVIAMAKYGFHETHIVVLNLCTALGIALGTIFRFWAYRTHVFKASPALASPALATAGAVEAPSDGEAGSDDAARDDEAHRDVALVRELEQLELADMIEQAEQPVRR